jgi:glycosyltransferase involved in cell wall biosynthesis
MTLPLVSVVIPNYNNAGFVTAALDSVLQQNYANLDIIVVDDGSTDHSLTVLQPYAARITLITQPNQGPAAARNNGIAAAKGQLIAFLDSDDLWLPGKVAAQVNYLLLHPDIAVCYCGWSEWHTANPGQKPPGQLTDVAPALRAHNAIDGNWLYLDLLRESVIHTISAMLRREVFDTVGFFNTDYRIGEDHDFWLRVAQHFKIAKLPQVYAIYRNNPQSTTKQVHDRNFSLLVLESALTQYGPHCPSGAHASNAEINTYLGTRHFTYGYNAMLQGKPDKALSSFAGCIRHRYRVGKALLFSTICSTPWLYKLFLQHKVGSDVQRKNSDR